jgi:hypothetical protein
MSADQKWRLAIEDALGVEADPENHTPAWANELVRTIREIGNQQTTMDTARESTDVRPSLSTARYTGQTRAALLDALLHEQPRPAPWYRRAWGQIMKGAGRWSTLSGLVNR